MYYDIEITADRYEQESTYALECNAEAALENAATQQRISEIDQQADDLLERMDAQLEAVKALRSSLVSDSSKQTEEETRMFEEWLS